MEYVSIRHGGAILGEANEINGLTMGSVGSGTSFNHIEVYANRDDAFEWFGGTVNMKYLVAMFHGDDAFDADQDFDGSAQFLYAVQGDTLCTPSQESQGFELDGDDTQQAGLASDGQFFNATVIGIPANGSKKNSGISVKSRFNGGVYNSIIANFAYRSILSGSLGSSTPELRGNIFVNCSSNETAWNANNTYVPSLAGFDFNLELARPADCNGCPVIGDVDPIPSSAGAWVDPIAKTIHPAIVKVNYKGAFKPGEEAWTAGWTVAAERKFDKTALICPTDVNKDGGTDGLDYLQVLGRFGKTCVQP
ncbi:MAG: hypothetical protein HC906_13885 [Bacteroidales bacterium]|nr:hypothetical protein [Bacteroidales bacterium]